tara:strand:+ start:35 stop:193 length:159 start_codon:yes stop_codon:yes gene_type:complete
MPTETTNLDVMVEYVQEHYDMIDHGIEDVNQWSIDTIIYEYNLIQEMNQDAN